MKSHPHSEGESPSTPRSGGTRSNREAASFDLPLGGQSPADGLSRRDFFGIAGGLTAAGLTGLPGLAGCGLDPAALASDGDAVPDPHHPRQRAQRAYQIRVEAARYQRHLPLPEQRTNGDEDRYPTRFANYSKGLPHDALGEVDPGAYGALIAALESGEPEDFEALPMGCADPARQRKLVNPQAGLAFDLQGADSHHMALPPPPAFAGAEAAGEMTELYWMALLRDVLFAEYEAHPLAGEAAVELTNLAEFRGPRFGGQVTGGTLFRGSTPGDLVGPYVSQFLWRPAPFGAQFVEQRMRTALAGLDHLTHYADWLEVQNGCLPSQTNRFEPTRRYIVTGRDLAQWVHVDVLFQAYFIALLILLTPPDPDPLVGGIGAPLNPGNPYNGSGTQIGFGTFGGPYFATLVCEVATRALKAVWYQKWMVHRRLRPEVFGGRVHNHVTGSADYPIHGDLLNSAALDEVFSRTGSYLLPQAYPEGSPLHPSYGAGHATVAGACVTVLKAFFDESFVIPNPVVPDPTDPTRLLPYLGPPLTVGGELHKLAANVALGRNFAGIHYRSDYTESLRLGEAVAIRILEDQRRTCNEAFEGFTFTTFDGDVITV